MTAPKGIFNPPGGVVKFTFYVVEGEEIVGEEFFNNNNGLTINGNIVNALARRIGETVTIFTKSGGASGCGFTGVLLGVNDCFVKLLSQIGPAPGCALGNACSGTPYANGIGCLGNMGENNNGFDNGFGNGYPIRSVGSVTDIPIDSIAAFVHNAV